MLPLVIYDYKVLCHHILHEVSSIPTKLQQDCINFYWAYTFFRGPERIKFFRHKTVVVDDGGTEEHPYWRKNIFPNYKAGRKPKTDLFYRIVDTGIDIIEKLNIDYFSIPSYEADDLAAHMIKIKRLYQSFDPDHYIANRPIYLLTVDSDWLQLVGNGVLWVNTGPWEPIVRGVPETLEWVKKRLKRNISHPQEIVAIKVIQGDKSDNLPAGSDPGLIDLMNPVPYYSLNGHPVTSQFMESLGDNKVTVDWDKSERAYRQFQMRRLNLKV